MTIPIAMAVGIYMFKIRPGAIVSGSIAGFILVCAAVFLGPYISGLQLRHLVSLQQTTTIHPAAPLWLLCGGDSVWLLLAPRDYLSTFMKIGVITALVIGMFFVNPDVKMPITTQFMRGGQPIIPGPWWPYVFITIACGAISGFML